MVMAKKCIGCGRVWLTWAQVQKSIAAMIAAGLTTQEPRGSRRAVGVASENSIHLTRGERRIRT
jgi:hypothetical protein